MGKLLPFAQECKLSRPDTIVQEDKAPAHAHHSQKAIYSSFDIQQLLWPGNSPDLNAIEPCWPFIKRTTTMHGAPRTKDEMTKAWLKAWRELDQSRIQWWIERIPRHIQQIIALEGGNEYRETRGLEDVVVDDNDDDGDNGGDSDSSEWEED